MARQKKIRLVKGGDRFVLDKYGRMQIANTFFCGECGRRTKVASTQKPYTEVARVCENVEKHKSGKKIFWPLKDVIIPTY